MKQMIRYKHKVMSQYLNAEGMWGAGRRVPAKAGMWAKERGRNVNTGLVDMDTAMERGHGTGEQQL